jgi:hypothetical protein
VYTWTERGKALCIFPPKPRTICANSFLFHMSEDEGGDSLTQDESNEDESNEVIFTDVSPFKIIVYL